MWHVKSVTVSTGEQAAIWGGLGTDVASRALGDRLGPEGSQYVLNIPHLGSIVLEDMGPNPTEWGIKVNGEKTYIYHGEGQINISVGSNRMATLSGGEGTLEMPLLATMDSTGIVTQTIFKLVNGAPSLHGEWNNDPMALLRKAGFPDTAMLNLRQSFGTAPDCCQQFETWLKTIQFTGVGELEAMGFGCSLCKIGMSGLAAAAVVAILAVCISNPQIEAAMLALEESTTIQRIASLVGKSTSEVARVAGTAGLSVAGAQALGEFAEGLCVLIGACDASDMSPEPV